jgi:putative peptide zinc metalloprotease protein
VNTKDGSTQYDVAFALVWADGSSVTNRNEAYAFASCHQCTTVAVAFQVVLITGSARVAIPQNVSGALNYSCVQCVTYALAQQLVLTVPASLTPQATQSLDSLWAQIESFAATIKNLPLDQIRARLLGYQDQIQAIVAGAAGASGQGSSTPTPTASSTSGVSPAPSASGAPPAPGATGTATTPSASNPSPGETSSPTVTSPAQASPSPSATAPGPTTPPSATDSPTATATAP